MYESIKQKTTEELAKYINEVMDYYLFSTGTGLLIVLATVLLVLGVIVISSQLGNVIKNQKSLLKKTTETNKYLEQLLSLQTEELNNKYRNNNVTQDNNKVETNDNKNEESKNKYNKWL